MVDLRQVRIDVTQDDLDHGERFRCEQCPAARAINRHLRDGYHAHVSYHYITIRGESLSTWADLRTPPEIQFTLMAIDHGKYVNPFSFVLDIPEGAYRG